MMSGTSKIAYSATLPCSHCIRNGYSYEYKAVAGQPTRDLQTSSDNYDGKCLIKQFDGTYLHGTTVYATTSSTLSDSYADKKVALSNCPTKTSICGTKVRQFSDASSSEVKLSVTNMESSLDSCHWMIKSLCDLPQIEIDSSMNMKTNEYKILTLEWSIDANKTLFDPTVADGSGDYLPPAAVSAWVADAGSAYYPGTLPGIEYTATGASVATKYPAYLVLDGIAAYQTAIDAYTTKLATYNTAKTKWDESVDTLSKYYKDLDDTPEPGFFDFLSPTVPPTMPDLTDKPTAPVVPTAYDGVVGADFSYYQGYGELTATWIKTHNDVAETLYPANKKYFGTFGQGTEDGLGYDVNPDTPAAVGGIPTCSNRFFSINLIPQISDSSKKLTSSIAKVKSVANSAPVLAVPTAPSAPVALKADPTREAAGGKILAVAATTAMSLAALTPY